MLAGGFDTGGFAMCPDRGNLAYVATRRRAENPGLERQTSAAHFVSPVSSQWHSQPPTLDGSAGKTYRLESTELHPVDFIHQRLGPTATIPSLSATHREPVALLSRVRGAHSVREMLERVYTVRRAGRPRPQRPRLVGNGGSNSRRAGPVAPAAGGVARSPARGRLRPQRLRQAGSVGSI